MIASVKSLLLLPLILSTILPINAQSGTQPVTTPLWESNWVQVLILFLILGLVYVIYRWQVSNIRARTCQLEEDLTNTSKSLDAASMRIHEETTKREKIEARLRKARDELAIVLAVSSEIVSTLDLQPLLILILDQLRKVLDFDVGTIRRLVNGNMELMAHRWLFPHEGQPSQHLPVSNIPIIQEIVQSRQAILVGDHQFDPEIVGKVDLYSGELTGEVLQASRTLMCVPLIVKDEVIGMLVLGHHQPNYWDEEYKELVQAFANQAAVAIANAELFERVEETATLEERTRLARDLHDSATQSLYSATLFTEAGKELAELGDIESAQHYFTRVGEVVHQALKDMRLLVFQLRPPILEEEGLIMALQRRLDAVEKRAGMDARLISDRLPGLSDSVSEQLYGITLEALNNTLKHAQAESVTITLRCDESILILEVCDDGQGFDPQSAYSGGMGLVNMTERAKKIGADLSIDANIDHGTRIRVSATISKTPSNSHQPEETSE